MLNYVLKFKFYTYKYFMARYSYDQNFKLNLIRKQQYLLKYLNLIANTLFFFVVVVVRP